MVRMLWPDFSVNLIPLTILLASFSFSASRALAQRIRISDGPSFPNVIFFVAGCWVLVYLVQRHFHRISIECNFFCFIRFGYSCYFLLCFFFWVRTLLTFFHVLFARQLSYSWTREISTKKEYFSGQVEGEDIRKETKRKEKLNNKLGRSGSGWQSEIHMHSARCTQHKHKKKNVLFIFQMVQIVK